MDVAKEHVQKADVVEIVWSFAFVFHEILILQCGNSGLNGCTIVIDICGV
jgi:hypothetical protein